MPIFEYECRECGERFSILLSASKRDETEASLLCPLCGAKGPRRMLSAFASTIKGSPTPPAHNCGGGG
jgi:putative FmdB family regulatory protein